MKLVDLGEGNTVPEEIPVKESRASGAWSRNLIAGAIAGGVSRTFTAPFDRLKTVMQVNLNDNAFCSESNMDNKIFF